MKRFSHLTIILQITCLTIAFAQSGQDKQKWYLMDPDSGKSIGTATNSAYSVILAGKTSTPIVVAVIDGGTDTSHPDLKPNLWNNPKEIAGNGKDDDNNGYIDDIHGWSFIGGKNGDTHQDNLELTRLYKLGKSGVPAGIDWNKVNHDYKKQKKDISKNIKLISQREKLLNGIKAKSAKDTVTLADVMAYTAHGKQMKLYKQMIEMSMQQDGLFSDFEKRVKKNKSQIETSKNYYLNTKFDPRSIVGDNYNDVNEHFYGNNNVMGPEALHGTHVAGIIAAVRNNGIGIDGIADNVKIMVVRVVPDGDERDKDVANGIRYAVDNGAKLINMSFGKDFSPNKSVVDEAVRYAASKGVLLIHAAGNDATNIDTGSNFPSPILLPERQHATNWIEVGATDSKGKAARFSNYGKNNVDIFAPGVQIYSTVPTNNYIYENGTSMAAPVVCGIAALIWTYYPNLSVEQVKKAILDGIQKNDIDTPLPGKPTEMVKFNSLSATGGIVNAKNALLNAAKY